MKIRCVMLLLLLICVKVNSQDLEVLKKYNGAYFLMKPERSLIPGKQSTSEKKLEIGNFGNDVLLATSECEKCTPSAFTFKLEESDKLGKPVFFNSAGLYMIPFDNESFIYVMPSQKIGGDWSSVVFSNFYSKNKGKVRAMTSEKLLSHIKGITQKYQE